MLAVGLLGLATIAAVVVSNGNPAVALTPCIAALLSGDLGFPAAAAMLVLLVLAWSLEIPGDAFAGNLVQTPLRAIGAVLFAKLNGVIPIDALVVSGSTSCWCCSRSS